MSKKLKRSAVALVLAATMVFSSQGVLTAFAAGGDIETEASVSSALERSLDKVETDVADESGNTDETETPEVTKPCDKTEGCTLSKDHEGECQVAPVDLPVEDENGEDETQPCTKTEGCTLENGHEGECVTEPVTPPEEENGEGETKPCEKTEGCTLPNGHEGECVVEENTEDTEDTQEPSEEDVAAAKNVSDLIGALPEASTLDPETTDVEALTAQVKAAREAYDKLTDAQKALVEKAVLDQLVALEGALEGLEQVETPPTDVPETAVAKIGESDYYNTLDEAIADAEEGATIELLDNCRIDVGFNKALTFTGNGKITIDKQLTSNGEAWMCFGLYNPSRELTFDGEGITVEWTSDGSAPWLMLSLSGTLNVTNGAKLTFQFDSRTTGTRNAIYMNAGSEINVTNGSTLQIIGVGTGGNAGQGIQLDAAGTAKVNVTGNSTFLIDATNRGYVNSPTIYVEDSKFTVQNCTSNGSNGGEFTAINSTITYQNNNGHGLSAGNVTIKNSTVDCNNNAYYGLTYSGDMTMDSTSKINANGNGYGYTGGGLRAYGTSTVEAGAVINILNNKRNGMEQYGDFVFKEGSEITVTGNNEPSTNGGGIFNNGTLTLPSNATITNNSAAQTGGGICNAGTVTIPAGVQLYNNHAGDAGDDIYNRENATITFGKVGSDWKLDGAPDCNHAITGWFDDSEGNRWEAHDAPYHAEEFDEFEKLTGMATITGLHTLKAAHGIEPIDPGEPGGGDWDVEHSKSKTATPLDANYESDVTLSLPSAEEQLESDVVFVLDKSTSTDVTNQINSMLEKLSAQVEETGASVKVGIVSFNKTATVQQELTPLTSDTLIEIQEAINNLPPISGTNMNAGLLAGKKLLDQDTDVDASRKYLIVVSDGISYYYCKGTDYETAYTISSLNGGDDGNGNKNCQPNSGASCFEIKYGAASISNWSDWYADMPGLLSSEYSTYEYNVDDPDLPSTTDLDSEGAIPYAERQNYPINVDISLYNSYNLYQDMMEAGYHCYSVFSEEDGGGTSYAFGPAFMKFMGGSTYLEAGEDAFSNIQNDIFYLLDADSSVVDVIGYGTDNAGNEYNFDFVDNLDNLKITVGGNELDKEDIIDPQFNDPYVTSAYGFGKGNEEYGYDFVLKYYQKGQDGNSDECFVWEINVPVSNFAPVQLTYTVKLTNPQTAEGTYGEYDANGENGSTSLYTNKEATLYPVDSNGDSGVPENFPKPTVSYTVGGNDNPGTDPTPDPDPDPDRPSRPNRDDDDDWEPLPDAPVKDKPTTEVDVPEETETPTTEQPDKYNPETGDTTTVFAAMALAAVSLGGVVLLGRKKK